MFLKIAHRGYSEKYPENTILAFEKAIEYGADMIELDIHLSRDRYLIVIHDDDIDRTSNGTGMVNDLSLDELKKFNYNRTYPEFGWLDIPTLDEVIDTVKGKAMLNIEIKNIPIKNHGIEEALVKTLIETDFMNNVVVSSFDYSSLKIIKRIEPKIKIGMLYEAVRANLEEEVKELQVYSIHPSIDTVQIDQLTWAKNNNIKIYPWVAKDRETISTIYNTGLVDGLMVNDLKLFDHL